MEETSRDFEIEINLQRISNESITEAEKANIVNLTQTEERLNFLKRDNENKEK